MEHLLVQKVDMNQMIAASQKITTPEERERIQLVQCVKMGIQ